MARQPKTRANKLWNAEIIRWDGPVILVIDETQHPMVASPVNGTDAHVVSLSDGAGRFAGYPENLCVSSDRLFESRHLESWVDQHHVRIIHKLPSSQSMVMRSLVDQLYFDCLNDLESSEPAEMAWALLCWRSRIIKQLRESVAPQSPCW
jgi:hypothetical protein